MKLQTQLIALLIASLAPITVVSVSAQGTTTTQSSTPTASSLRALVTAQLPSGVTIETASDAQLRTAIINAVNANPSLAAQIAASVAVYSPEKATVAVKAATAAATSGESNVQTRAEILAKIANTAAAAQSSAGTTGRQNAETFARNAAPDANLTEAQAIERLPDIEPDPVPTEETGGGTDVEGPLDPEGDGPDDIDPIDLPSTLEGIQS
ncbi:MAG: hypothetical protein Q7P63_12610 [Verrucomicrobiota bacterium JB022]|nr:hypothetical protein [Verrucomicrobiota bacterium JB022]